MTFYRPNPTAALLDSENNPVSHVTVEQVAHRLDRGWELRARVHGPFDPYTPDTETYKVEWTDGLGNSRLTPPMVLAEVEYQDPLNVRDINLSILTGDDQASYKMRASNQNFATFRDTTSSAYVSALASRAGVTISGVPSFYVSEDEVKGAKLSDALERIKRVSAYDSIVNTSGQIVLSAWEASASALSFSWSKRTHKVSKRQLFTGIRLGKSTALPPSGEQYYEFPEAGFWTQALDSPLIGPAADDVSLSGSAGAVTFWNGDPGNPASEWVEHYDFTVPNNTYPPPETPQGTGPATHFTIVVLPSVFAGVGVAVRVLVTGTPEEELPEGVDAEFLWPAVSGDPDTSLGARPAPDMIDALFPSQSYAQGRAPYILAKLNSGADTITLTGPLQCAAGVDLLRIHTYDGRDYKAAEVVWNLITKQTSILCRRV